MCVCVYRKVLLCVTVEIEHITSPVSRKVQFLAALFMSIF